MSGMFAIRSIGVLVMLAGLACGVRQDWLAFQHHVDTQAGRGSFLYFLCRRRRQPDEFTPEGWRHWKRGEWLVPATWLLGAALVLLSL